MRLREHVAANNPPLVRVQAQIPANTSGNTSSVTVNIAGRLRTMTGRQGVPEVVIPVVRGSYSSQITVSVGTVTDTQVQLLARSSGSSVPAVDVDLYLG